MKDIKQSFIDEINSSIKNNEFVRVSISKNLLKKDDLKNIRIKKVKIKNDIKLSFVFKHATKDITKNYSVKDGIELIDSLLGKDFGGGVLFTTQKDISIDFDKKMVPKISINKPTFQAVPDEEHDRKKKRFVQIEDSVYLRRLGVTTQQGDVVKGMQDKYKQIDKYVEILDSMIRTSYLKNNKKINVVDMGSGKGYLTFALYDYLVNQLNIEANVTGIELRDELVKSSNDIADEAGFKNLKFVTGEIENYRLEEVDILIALHACDTATDDAIYKGITSEAKMIVIAPCCHKQIRKEINVSNEFKNITKFGILKERQSELVTDGLRALLMEMNGYTTKVLEFISGEHTPKNIMIIGLKNDKKIDKSKYTKEIAEIKEFFGIKEHYLEKLLKNQ